MLGWIVVLLHHHNLLLFLLFIPHRGPWWLSDFLFCVFQRKIQIYFFLLKMWKMNPESLFHTFHSRRQWTLYTSGQNTWNRQQPTLLVNCWFRDDDDGSVEKMMKLKPVCTSHLKLCRVKSRGLVFFLCVYGNIVRESQSVETETDWLSTASFSVIHVLLCCRYDSFPLFMAAFLLDNTVMYRKLTFTTRNHSRVVVLLRQFWVVVFFFCKRASSSSTNKENQSHLCDAMKRSDAEVCPDFF